VGSAVPGAIFFRSFLNYSNVSDLARDTTILREPRTIALDVNLADRGRVAKKE
jgi:hypothetical protein